MEIEPNKWKSNQTNGNRSEQIMEIGPNSKPTTTKSKSERTPNKSKSKKQEAKQSSVQPNQHFLASAFIRSLVAAAGDQGKKKPPSSFHPTHASCVCGGGLGWIAPFSLPLSASGQASAAFSKVINTRASSRLQRNCMSFIDVDR